MVYSHTEIKCLRKDFSKIPKILDLPYLLSIQINSYNDFLYNNKNKLSGLNLCFNSVFPICNYNNTIKLNYLNYKIVKPIFTDRECLIRGLTYSISLKVKLCLYVYNILKNKRKLISKKKQRVYFGDIPLMTDRGTFIVNGTERVVVSQLHRSPGVFFSNDKGKINTSGKILYNARIIPYRGSWLDFGFDSKDILYMRIDRKRKLPFTIILKALGYFNIDILNLFFKFLYIKIINKKIFMKFNPNQWENKILSFDIIFNNKKYLSKGKKITYKYIKKMILDDVNYILIPYKYLINKIISKDFNFILNKKKYKIFSNTKIDKKLLNKLININCNIYILYIDDLTPNYFILNTLLIDNTFNKSDALKKIYHIIRPGEPFNLEISKKVFHNLFFSYDKYDLSIVGRMKLNLSLGIKKLDGSMVLEIKDIINIIKKLINIKNGIEKIDDIDNLGNRRVKCVGEMIENQFRIGLIRIEKIVKDRFSIGNLINTSPQDIINAKILSIIIKDFFCSSQLSQFMDQNNLLAEITHKRRISALGPGGLTRERAGFEIRDIHSTHYGRVCPIETPEGPNIGLINSLSIYAKINKYGFIETPYRKIKNGYLTNDICYLSAIEENNYIIAPANICIVNNKIKDNFIVCRYNGEFNLFNNNKINYMDVSSQQIVSVGASLIPFLENDDANRALMGANMQRQAVPCLIPDRPLVGTGMERIVANDSGICIISKNKGIVKYVDSSKIVIEKYYNYKINNVSKNIIIYNLFKYLRSNQNTCINQKPCVNLGDKVKKGDILADGFSTHLGELSLGQNVRVAFMSWYGYNFEDSILISENIIHKDIFTSLHIQELSCICRDTKLGSEEITSDIPNINDDSLFKLDENGIINIGSEVSVGDILVGKITPKGETQLSPEEKLLRAIFGEKASEVKDSSLRVPSGCSGKVIDVQIFLRDGVLKDKRSLNIENYKLKNIKKKINKELLYFKENLINCINKILKKFNICFSLNIDIKEIFNLNIKNLNIKNRIFKLINSYKKLKKLFNKKLNKYINKIVKFNELNPGILKIVKVYIAIKRQIQVGDKMSGRHGNKGVISKICPIEDMPYDKNGIPIDVILNPLSVPSRMNIGQVLETHLGMALKTIGDNINYMLNNNFNINKIKSYIKKIYYLNNNKNDINLNLLSDDEFMILAKSLVNGVLISTPVFDSISENEIKKLLSIAKLPNCGQINLYDGLTGKKFERKVTVGYMYIMKLNHLIDDKIHARSTGSYSLITQQPLGGKSQFGGQRFGEMEVWALEAYGAAYTLQEMLTIKSDDISGRTKMYKNIIKGNYKMEPGMPESFNVLIKEICSLCINIQLKK